MVAPSSLDISQAVSAVGSHLKGAAWIRIRGEIVELTESERGWWLRLADHTAVVQLFIPPHVMTGTLHTPQVLEVTAALQQKAGGSEWYLRATSKVRVVDEAGPIANQRRQAAVTLEQEGHAPPLDHDKFDYLGQHRQQLPHMEKVIVLTGRKAAAWGDFVGGLSRNHIASVVEPRYIRVQGEGMVTDLVAELGRIGPDDADLVFLVRGGGAWADLRLFDDVRVARAVAAAKVPVATAVGHTKDVSLADRVADYAFSTPSVAGEALRRALSQQVGLTTARGRTHRRAVSATRSSAPEQRVSVTELTELLAQERKAAEYAALVQQQKHWDLTRSYTELSRFTDEVLLDGARARVRTRSRILTVMLVVAATLALGLARVGDRWSVVGAGVALLAAAGAVYVWRGPRRAERPASARAQRSAPDTVHTWREQTLAARTPRALRVLRAVDRGR